MKLSATRECEVLVIGSGAAGLAAAVTAAEQGLKVLVVEKARHLGGSSAWSGGWLWIPRNPLAIAEGRTEAEGEPERYLQEQTGGAPLDALQHAYLQHGPQMVRFFESRTAVHFYSGTRMPDMHDGPGAAPGGRSLCALPYDGGQLGPWLARMRAPLSIVSLFGLGIAGGADMAHFFNASRAPRSAWHVYKRLSRHAWDLLRHGRGRQLVNGNALVARLLRSALDRQVEFVSDCPAQTLIMDGARVTGAVVEIAGQRQRILASRGVVLACGGFPHDSQRTTEQLKQGPHYSAAPRHNSGDGLRLGEQAGAQVARDLPQAAAWAPVSLVPHGDGHYGHFPHLLDRAKPGFIAVNLAGQRFTNEANCYHDFMTDLFASTTADSAPCAWLICDHPAQRRFGIGWAKPFPFPLAPYRRSGYLKQGATLAALAEQCGLDATALQATVAQFNGPAAQGLDPLFKRGESAYNHAQGDIANTPNPSLRPLLEGPFYAVKLLPGSLGTFAGLPTDCDARVIDRNGRVIEGLFAVGNDMNSVMRGHYPSGGITLGPGMTFGYLAGLALAAPQAVPHQAHAAGVGSVG